MDVRSIVRDTIKEIGYTRAKYGFDAETCGVMVAIDGQSPDIAQGVDESFEAQHGDIDPIDRIGAGDQGMMFGYASNETDELMPLPIMLAHKLARRLAQVRKAEVLPYLRPDGKSQVTVRYEVDEHGIQRPVEIERVLISTQHRDGLDAESLIKPDLLEHVVEPILHADYPRSLRPGPARLEGLPLRQPDREVRDRRADGGHGPHGAQDHRRHLRRRGAARRRRLLGQGPDEGRPLRRLRGPVRREERRRGGARRAVPGAGRLRDRRRTPDERSRRHVRHRGRGPDERADLGARARALRPPARRDRPRSRPVPPDLPEDRGLRALRPHRLGRLHLGAHGQGRRAFATRPGWPHRPPSSRSSAVAAPKASPSADLPAAGGVERREPLSAESDAGCGRSSTPAARRA